MEKVELPEAYAQAFNSIKEKLELSDVEAVEELIFYYLMCNSYIGRIVNDKFVEAKLPARRGVDV